MKAAQISQYGGPEVVTVNEVEKPVAGAGQVLVEVQSASLNPFDSKLREGYMKDRIPLQFPFTLGGDIAGIVTEVGEGVASLATGDKVYGTANALAGSTGAFAEFAAVKAEGLAHIPTNLDFEHAASLPLVGVSAWQALVKHLDLQPGQKIFIHGGAGGIGSVAIELAKHIGAYVATTATGEGLTLVKELGADQVVDYKAEDFTNVLHDFDAVFDTVGGEDFDKTLDTLKRGGAAVSMAGMATESKTTELGVTALSQGTKVVTGALDALRELIEAGVVTPRIDSVFPLEQISEAFTARESGPTKGKIVIQIKQ